MNIAKTVFWLVKPATSIWFDCKPVSGRTPGHYLVQPLSKHCLDP